VNGHPLPPAATDAPLLGVYLICCNEEQHIARALASVAAFDELVVVDSGSTDRTLEIARAHGATVYSHPWEGYSRQKQHALSLCRARYVLNLDADEEATPELAAELRAAATAGRIDALEVPIAEVFLGAAMPPGVKRNAKVRFFRRALGSYGAETVHEGIRIEGRIERAHAAIRHYGEDSLATKVDKINRYSSLRAAERYRRGRRPSTLKLLAVFPLALLKSLLLRRTLLAGRRGLIAAVSNAYYAFLKEAKLFEARWRDRGPDGD
jgi:glycosyltransferase involved in cell wall biosynthesis